MRYCLHGTSSCPPSSPSRRSRDRKFHDQPGILTRICMLPRCLSTSCKTSLQWFPAGSVPRPPTALPSASSLLALGPHSRQSRLAAPPSSVIIILRVSMFPMIQLGGWWLGWRSAAAWLSPTKTQPGHLSQPVWGAVCPLPPRPLSSLSPPPPCLKLSSSSPARRWPRPPSSPRRRAQRSRWSPKRQCAACVRLQGAGVCAVGSPPSPRPVWL